MVMNTKKATAPWLRGPDPYNLYRPSTYRTTGVDVKVAPGLNIGYVVGAGDEVPQSLVNLGIRVHFLSPGDLANADLSKFDAIVTGVRAYAVREDLKTYNGRLLEYVKNGGVAIVQYNTPEYDHNYGPYPYKMGDNPEEVTDEDSKVEILEPSNPIFNWPNKITSKDFENWVEERGSKFLSSWDPHYQALLETHDPGQDPQKGGLVYARDGKGVYIYCAYAFYRQMPEAPPGSLSVVRQYAEPKKINCFADECGTREECHQTEAVAQRHQVRGDRIELTWVPSSRFLWCR